MNQRQMIVATIVQAIADFAVCVGNDNGWTIEETQQWIRHKNIPAYFTYMFAGDHPLAVIVELMMESTLDLLIEDKMTNVEIIIFECDDSEPTA